jgi:hypothetical protein
LFHVGQRLCQIAACFGNMGFGRCFQDTHGPATGR